MVQLNELFNLAVVLVLGPLLILNRRRAPIGPDDRYWGIALGFVVGAYVTTVLEGFFWADALNVAEHAFLAIAGVFFVIALYGSLKTRGTRE